MLLCGHHAVETWRAVMSDQTDDALKQAFEQSAKDIHALDERPHNDTLLRHYAPPNRVSSTASAPPSTKRGPSSRAPPRQRQCRSTSTWSRSCAADAGGWLTAEDRPVAKQTRQRILDRAVSMFNPQGE